MCKKIDKGLVYAFRTRPDFAQNLADAGFRFMNLANNHMNDFGPEGIESTIRALTNVGIKYGGPNGEIGRFEIGRKKNSSYLFLNLSWHQYNIRN